MTLAQLGPRLITDTTSHESALCRPSVAKLPMLCLPQARTRLVDRLANHGDRSGILEELYLVLPPAPKLRPVDAGALRSLAALMNRSADDPMLRHRVFMLLQVRARPDVSPPAVFASRLTVSTYIIGRAEPQCRHISLSRL